MKEETTKAGRLYGVCSAGECIVTDAETGLVLANLNGSKQEAFFAIGSKVYVSDDAAVVTEAFNLAPCRGAVAMMLLRKAGGLLPKGFTELEYLESSGTQYIDTGIATDGTYTVRAKMQISSGSAWGRAFKTSDYDIGGCSFCRFLTVSGYYYLHFLYYWGGAFYGDRPNYTDVEWDKNEPNVLEAVEGVKSVKINGQNSLARNLNTLNVDASNPNNLTHYVFWANGLFSNGNGKARMKLYQFALMDGTGHTVLDFVPALRESDGVAGMFDRVSKQFFVNKGTGSFGYRIKGAPATFALRDPHRVAPSGVYARPFGENELEVLADTEETTGDGWEWFANTVEAYEYFGITQDELLTE